MAKPLDAVATRTPKAMATYQQLQLGVGLDWLAVPQQRCCPWLVRMPSQEGSARLSFPEIC